jgi:hypothetical protein
MGEKARDIWIHYAKGNSQEAYARAKELLRKTEISVMDKAYLHLLLANDPSERGVPHAQEADRILTVGKAVLRKQKKVVHFDTLLHISRQLHGDANSAKNDVNKSDEKN